MKSEEIKFEVYNNGKKEEHTLPVSFIHKLEKTRIYMEPTKSGILIQYRIAQMFLDAEIKKYKTLIERDLEGKADYFWRRIIFDDSARMKAKAIENLSNERCNEYFHKKLIKVEELYKEFKETVTKEHPDLVNKLFNESVNCN